VAVPCLLLFLCFRKATQEIFSELDETKAETPIFPGQRTKTKGEPEGGQRATTPGVARPPPGRATKGWAPLVHFLTPPRRLYKASWRKTLNRSAIFQKKSRSSAAATDEFQGIEVSVPAPYRDGEVPPEPSPSMPSPPSPSPSTSPPSPPTLLSPMMRRE
jgi:hypothetical protein